jgi:hypothetical protein
MDAFLNGHPASSSPSKAIHHQGAIDLSHPCYFLLLYRRLPNGQHAYHGHVINLEQKNVEWLQSVRRSVQDLPDVAFVWKSNPNITDNVGRAAAENCAHSDQQAQERWEVV